MWRRRADRPREAAAAAQRGPRPAGQVHPQRRRRLTFAGASGLVASVRHVLDVAGSVGVIVADERAADVLATLRSAGIAAEPLDADARVSVVPAFEAKGPEFDSVVLLDPAEIVAAEPRRDCGGSTSCSPAPCRTLPCSARCLPS